MAVPAEVHCRLVEIFGDVFDAGFDPSCKEIGPEDVDDWDSLSQLRLINEIEEIFQLQLDDDEAIGATSLSAVEQILAKRGVIAVPEPLE